MHISINAHSGRGNKPTWFSGFTGLRLHTFQSHFGSQQRRLEGQTVSDLYLLLDSGAPVPFLGHSWQSCRLGRARPLPYNYQPQKPTPPFLVRQPLTPLSFTVGKPTPACLCPHLRSTEQRGQCDSPLGSLPVTSALPCPLLLPYLFLSWTIAPTF